MDEAELVVLGVHCSKTERRAEVAEREVIKLRLLDYLSTRIGLELDAVITGVSEYGFYAQGEIFPAEGLVHIRTLLDDYYNYDAITHTLEGKRSQKRYRLGDRLRVRVIGVERARRQIDFEVLEKKKREFKKPAERFKRKIKGKKKTKTKKKKK